MASSTLVQQRTSNASMSSPATRPRTSGNGSTHASPASRSMGASSPSPRLASTLFSSASKASVATGSATLRSSNGSVAGSPPSTPTSGPSSTKLGAAALASQNKKKTFDEIEAAFPTPSSSKSPRKPTSSASSPPLATSSSVAAEAASVPAAPAPSPIGGANGYASLSSEAIEAQRIATELEELHANVVRFVETTHIPRKVTYEPVNKPGASFTSVANANGKRPNGLVAPLSTSSSVESSPERPNKKLKAGSSGAPIVEINAGGSQQQQGQKREPLYAKKLSFKMPAGVSKRAGGLVNFGNSCYMNSVLQSLIHLPPLAYALIEQSEEVLRGPNGGPGQGTFDPLVAMKHLVHKVVVNGTTTQPRVFNEKLKTYAKSLRKGHQEDAHEFMRHLLEAMHQCGLPRPPRALDTKDPQRLTTLIHQIFGGRLRSRVTCLKCKAHSDTFDPILDLSLDIRQSTSLEQALKTFTTVERLHGTGNDRYKCEACKSRVTAEKRFTIDALPRVLTIHFKRFTPLGTKLSRKVDYPPRLHISASVLSENASPATYALHAVVHHHGGGPNSGHYVADVKAPVGTGWCHMNDSSVSSTSPPRTGEKSAYLLFYVMEQEGLAAATSNALASSSSAAHINGTPRNLPFKSPLSSSSALAERQAPASASPSARQKSRPIPPSSDDEDDESDGGAPSVESTRAASRKRRAEDSEEDLVDVAEQKRLERQATSLLSESGAAAPRALSSREEREAVGLPSGFGKPQRKPAHGYGGTKKARLNGNSPYAVGSNSFDRPKGKKHGAGAFGSTPAGAFYGTSNRKSSYGDYGDEDTGAPEQRGGYESLSGAGQGRKKKKGLEGRWDAGFSRGSGVKDKMKPRRH